LVVGLFGGLSYSSEAEKVFVGGKAARKAARKASNGKGKGIRKKS